MDTMTITLEQLHACIGRQVICDGEPCLIIEVIDDGPMLVLNCLDGITVVQANQHGEATRRVPRTRTLPVYSTDGAQLHPAFLKLNLEF